jgi:hypothetical protein
MKSELLLIIMSGTSTVLVSIVGFFLKDLINQFKVLRDDVYKINTLVNNINKDMGYNTARIDLVEKKLDIFVSELDDVSEKLTILRTEHDLRICKKYEDKVPKEFKT